MKPVETQVSRRIDLIAGEGAAVPVAEHGTSHQEIVKSMRDLRKHVKKGDMSVRDMVTEGRRE